MNFLAHLYFSNNDPGVMAGNFAGDFIKGKLYTERFSQKMLVGIALHRSIDAYTDSHPQVRKSKKRLSSVYGHYAGVIVDIYYDHFLAGNWSLYHTESLSDYANQCYRILQDHVDFLPVKAQRTLLHMAAGNWLVHYAQLQGIRRVLAGMSQRTTFVSKMEMAIQDLELHYHDFKHEFELFFPDITQHCRGFLSSYS